jgi:hypothetical protein
MWRTCSYKHMRQSSWSKSCSRRKETIESTLSACLKMLASRSSKKKDEGKRRPRDEEEWGKEGALLYEWFITCVARGVCCVCLSSCCCCFDPSVVRSLTTRPAEGGPHLQQTAASLCDSCIHQLPSVELARSDTSTGLVCLLVCPSGCMSMLPRVQHACTTARLTVP